MKIVMFDLVQANMTLKKQMEDTICLLLVMTPVSYQGITDCNQYPWPAVAMDSQLPFFSSQGASTHLFLVRLGFFTRARLVRWCLARIWEPGSLP